MDTFRTMKKMRLYDRVERIHNELSALGIDEDSPLDVEDLSPFDHYHYHGTKAVDAAISALDLTANSHVLDIGSGIGGPARYMAAKVGCRVSALELQDDLDATARDLTRRCGLHGLVEHCCGNILEVGEDFGPFDAITAHLVILHIAERGKLFATCRRLLAPGGRIYIEDFTKIGEPSDDQRRILSEKVFCPYLPTADEYLVHLNGAGLSARNCEDMTRSWRTFTEERLSAFRAGRRQKIELYGEELTEGLEDFYHTVATLFREGVIGGLRITAECE